jgi:hypothetical protein
MVFAHGNVDPSKDKLDKSLIIPASENAIGTRVSNGIHARHLIAFCQIVKNGLLNPTIDAIE